MAYVLYHNDSEYDGVRFVPSTTSLSEVGPILDTRIRVNLEENFDISLPALCKVLSIPVPTFTGNLEDRLKHAHEFVAELGRKVNENDSSPRRFMLPPPASRIVRGFDVRTSPTLEPPRIDHISEDVISKLFASGDEGDEERKTKALTRVMSRSCSPGHYGTYPRLGRGRIGSYHKTYEIERPMKPPTDTLSVVTRIIEASSPTELEGRAIATVANQLLNSNRQLSHLRQDPANVAEIERCINHLHTRGAIKLSKDGSRFGLVRLAEPPFFEKDPLSEEVVTQIWTVHMATLIKATSFRSAVNILANSCSQLHIFLSDEKIRVAEWLILEYLNRNLLS